MDIILGQMTPYKGIVYFADYFTTQAAIVVDKNRLQIKRIYRLFILVLLKSIHFFYLFLFPLSLEVRIIHYDVMVVAGLPQHMNAFAIGLTITICYYLYMLYFANYNCISFLIRDIIIREKTDFFLQKNQGRMPICRYIKNFTLVVVNGLQLFIIVIDLFVVTTQLHVVHQFWHVEADFYQNALGWARLLLMENALILLYIALYIFSHSCILMATMGVTMLQIFTIKLSQVRHILLERRRRAGVNHHRFLRENVKTLGMILRANQLYGRALFIFLVVNCPTNCVLVASLIMAKISFMQGFFVAFFVAAQIIAIFGIHSLVASLNKRIHRPSRLVMSICIRNNFSSAHRTDLALRVKLDNYIQAFHVRNKYGITYAKFGLITVRSFTKYIILYSQLLMYSYKMLHQNRYF